MPFDTISQVKAANKAIGNHWFDRGSMRFFNTKIESKLYGGRYFITSEQFVGSTGAGRRKYSIRYVNDDGSIDTVGEFNEMPGIELARYKVKRLLELEKELLTHTKTPRVGIDLELWEWLQKHHARSAT